MTTRQLADMTFAGESVAGIGTAIAIKEFKFCFDLGALTPHILGCNSAFISHAHTDHAGEVMNYLAVRALQHRNLATLFVPAPMGPQFREIITRWQEMADSRFDYRVIELYPGAPAPLKHRMTVTPFELEHGIPTYGFLVEQAVEKLKPEHLNLPANEIARLKNEPGADLFYRECRPLVAYVPDTLPEGLDAMPQAAWNARVLLLEASFLDSRKPLEKVRKGRHLVLDDIVERLERFSGEHILLFHFSQIYKPDEVIPLVRNRLPDGWSDRVHCFI